MSKTRVQLDLKSEEVESLDRLQDLCGLRSRADAVRTALAVVEWMSQEVESGKKILAVNGEMYSELVIPGLTLRRNV